MLELYHGASIDIFDNFHEAIGLSFNFERGYLGLIFLGF